MLQKMLVKFFESARRVNEERFAQMQTFVQQVMSDFPIEIVRAIPEKESLRIHPTVTKQDYYLGFTTADVVWWETKFRTENLIIRPVDLIVKGTYRAIADIIERKGYSVLEPELKLELDRILHGGITK